LPFVATIVVMLITDLLIGVITGLLITVFFIIRQNIRSTFETSVLKEDDRLNYTIKLPQHVTFFNKGFLITYFSDIASNSVVTIDGSINKICDKDVLEVIKDFEETAPERKINLHYINFELK